MAFFSFYLSWPPLRSLKGMRYLPLFTTVRAVAFITLQERVPESDLASPQMVRHSITTPRSMF